MNLFPQLQADCFTALSMTDFFIGMIINSLLHPASFSSPRTPQSPSLRPLGMSGKQSQVLPQK
jgi:hypothetical protein